MNYRSTIHLGLLAVILLGANACKKESTGPGTPSTGATTTTVDLGFSYKVNGTTFTPGDLITDGEGRLVRLDLFRFFVSGVKATDMGGSAVADPQNLYIIANAAQPAARSPLGPVVGLHLHMLHFTLGVDSITNHAISPSMDPVPPAPLNDQTMSWLWNTNFGYKFVDIAGRLDVNGDGVVEPGEGAFTIHAAGDALRIPHVLGLYRDLQAGANNTIILSVDLTGLLSGITLQGVGHMDLQGPTPRTHQLMVNLANGIYEPE